MYYHFPKKLSKWDEIRIIAPSRSLSLIWPERTNASIEFLNNLWYKVTLGEHVWEINEFDSSSIHSRLDDIHSAFLDKNVACILTAIWGYNSNELIDKIDYSLIRNNPKILCWYSDITALTNSITKMSWLVTYMGPHFSTFSMKKWFEHTLNSFQKCLVSEDVFILDSPKYWSDDSWYFDQENRNFIDNDWYWCMNPGIARGISIGGHLRCISSLQWTKYMPNLNDSILIIEEDYQINTQLFWRMLYSLIQQEDFKKVKGIIIWKFQKESSVSKQSLERIIQSYDLDYLPIIANVDIWHTSPIWTLPIWWTIEINAAQKSTISIIKH